MTGFAITNAQLLDPAAGQLRPGASVRVEGDRIVEVAEDGAALSGEAGVQVLDAAGRTLMPGLIDAHVHPAITTMDLAVMARRSPTRIGIEAKTILEGMLRRGFTTVRDAGGMDGGLQEALRAGLISGPRVFRSGRVLSQTGGHGDIAPVSADPHIGACSISSTSFAHVADGPDAVRRAAREELKGGADQIKVMAGGGVATPTTPSTWCSTPRRDPGRGRGSRLPADLRLRPRLRPRGHHAGGPGRRPLDRARQPDRC